MRQRLLIAAVAAVAAAGGFVVQRWQAQRAAADQAAPTTESIIGQSLPDFQFPALTGGTLSRADIKNRPVLINLWATWCAPCREEMPALEALHQRHAADGFQVLGVALDEAGRVAEFLKDTPVTYPILLTETLPGITFARSLGNRSGVLPYSIWVGADGKVASVTLGEMQADTLNAQAAELLAEAK